MAFTFGFSVAETNWMTTWPPELTVALNHRSMARFCPPAEA